MNKIDILIIEDNIEEATILEHFLTNHNFNVIGKITNLQDSLEAINSINFDIAIIDIYLNNKADGFTIAEKINTEFHAQKPFLFLTGASGRQEFNKAKFLAPYSYLLKPFNELELIYTLELVIEKYNKKQNDLIQKYFPLLIKKKDTYFKVEENDILHIEVEGRYCNIITSDGDFLIKSSLDDFYKLLPKKTFTRTHRRYIVNKNVIKQFYINDNLIILKNNIQIPIGRAYKNSFINQYNIIK